LYLLLYALHANAQETGKITDVTRINFLAPGISYEKGVGLFQSIFLEGFVDVAFTYSYSEFLGSNTAVYLLPGLSAQYRYFYNARQREEKGKRTAVNSLNYVAPAFEMVFFRSGLVDLTNREPRIYTIKSLGAVWGMQRNYPRHFSLDLNLGYGLLFGRGALLEGSSNPNRKYAVQASPLAHLTLGFWLNKKPVLRAVQNDNN
jgi:hypothetical protein